jgi:hypothetical protein
MESRQSTRLHVEDNFCSPENSAFYESKPYEELDNSTCEIRLVQLELAHRNQSKLELQIDSYRLSAVHDFYYAISYAAGDHKETEVISVNNKDFNAFRSLEKALRRIRDQPVSGEAKLGSAYAIWVDQICINQNNSDERAYQVEHMREIYETARSTIIYLGDDSRDGRGMKFLTRISGYCRDRSAVLGEEDWTNILNRGAEWVVNHATNPVHAEDWMAVREILEAPWWRRGWICQEAIVSRDASVLYGASLMNIAHFTVAVEAFVRAYRNILAELYTKFRSDPDTKLDEYVVNLISGFDMEHVQFILRHRQDWVGGAFGDIKPLLRHSRSCETTDPRDKVYAFAGLADLSYKIKPIYRSSNSLADTFANTAACIILKEKSLDILFDASDDTRIEDLPSWAPNWVSKYGRTPFLLHNSLEQPPAASANYPGRAKVLFPGSSSEGYGRVLRIEVLSLGRLSLQHRFGPADEGSPLEKWENWERKAGFRGLEYHGDTYVAGGTLEDAFVSTILLGGPQPTGEPYLEDIRGSRAYTQSLFRSFRVKEQLGNALEGDWCFFVTPGGYIGLAISGAQYDDYLCIGLGASVPFVLRKCGDCYKFIGEAYVHGMMYGEAIELMKDGRLEVEEVDIM